ncbi:uncharacterized protein RAG0_05462 [Rhynchosporium agropyri]|uniref:Uncharacterized protein n=1 Tax=Rhynchosporium agropyri TaxID=914238 RepID=A0A1E1KD66_9HELO|nr:uncharacterized protein RAG0_05462 [Rhynchosporium agropyri]
MSHYGEGREQALRRLNREQRCRLDEFRKIASPGPKQRSGNPNSMNSGRLSRQAIIDSAGRNEGAQCRKELAAVLFARFEAVSGPFFFFQTYEVVTRL